MPSHLSFYSLLRFLPAKRTGFDGYVIIGTMLLYQAGMFVGLKSPGLGGLLCIPLSLVYFFEATTDESAVYLSPESSLTGRKVQ